MARRARVEHGPTADGRVRAENDAVAACGDDRLRQAQLREALAHAGDPRHDLARAVVDLDAGRDLVHRLERDVEPVARTEGARRDERVAAAKLGALDARQRDGDALARLGALDRTVVHLDAADPHLEARGLGAERVAFADRAGPERPGRDGPDRAQREDAVDVEARGAERGGVRDRVGGTREGGAQLVQAGAGLRADRHHLGAGDQLAGLLERELERLRVDAVRLRHRDDAGVDPQQAQDRQVLVRLQTGPLRRVDHE